MWYLQVGMTELSCLDGRSVSQQHVNTLLMLLNSSRGIFGTSSTSVLLCCGPVIMITELLEQLNPIICNYFGLCTLRVLVSLHRSYNSRHQLQYSSQRGFLDGKLLWEYLHLSGKEMTDFAKQIGTSPAQVS